MNSVNLSVQTTLLWFSVVPHERKWTDTDNISLYLWAERNGSMLQDEKTIGNSAAKSTFVICTGVDCQYYFLQ